jgi:hypothetical protein
LQQLKTLNSLLAEFSKIQLAGSNASYMATCLESVIRRSPPTILSELSAHDIKFLVEVGYMVQSTTLPHSFLKWMDQFPDSGTQFVNLILSCKFLRNSSLTPFEVSLFTPLAIRFDSVAEEVCRKFASSPLDLDMIKVALALAEKLKNIGSGASRADLINAGLQTVLRGSEAIVRAIFDNEDISDQSWELVANFILHSTDVDPEDWLGKVCKHDMENLNPKASEAVNNALRKDPAAFHRLLPGWLHRVLSRFTRRFAEDPVLSESTLSSVAAFSIGPCECC